MGGARQTMLDIVARRYPAERAAALAMLEQGTASA
jgi:hypothetical protein